MVKSNTSHPHWDLRFMYCRIEWEGEKNKIEHSAGGLVDIRARTLAFDTL